MANSAVYKFPKPTIALIRGYCIGGGMGLALACDLRICSDKSRFGVPAAKLGLGYPFKGIKRLVDVVGPSFAKEIFYTARQFSAAEALQMGLVNRVLADAEVETYVKDYADTISANAPLTVNSVKYIVGEVVKDESERNLQKCADLVAQCFASNDYIEGRKAFMEKRKPKFTGLIRLVMAGLVPAIPLRRAPLCFPKRGHRDKPGDEAWAWWPHPGESANPRPTFNPRSDEVRACTPSLIFSSTANGSTAKAARART